MRISKLVSSGGNISDAFGVINVRGPGAGADGVPFRVLVGEVGIP